MLTGSRAGQIDGRREVRFTAAIAAVEAVTECCRPQIDSVVTQVRGGGEGGDDPRGAISPFTGNTGRHTAAIVIAEALLSAAQIDATQPCPAIAERWRSAIADWRFDPAVVDKEPFAACMTVTVNVHVQ